MNAIAKFLAAPLALSFWILFSGCGGGGDGGGADGAAGSANPGLAPASAANKSVRITETNQPTHEIQFAANGDSFTQFEVDSRNPIRSGTYVYESAGDTATLRLTDSASGEFITLTLNFVSPTAGTYSLTSSTGQSSKGTFYNFTQTIPDGGGNPNPNPNPGGGNPNPDGGNGGLDGRVLSLTRSTGQTHFYTFTGNRFLDEDGNEKGAGNYSYTRTGNQAQLILNYTENVSGPVVLAGDRHEINMLFTSDNAGTFTSTYFFNDGGSSPQDGRFQFEQ